MTDIKKFTATFNRIAHGKSEEAVFTDFLDIVLCALSAGRYEEEYLTIVKHYKREEVDMFCELLAEMIIIMDNEGAGLQDCLGEFFQLHITHGRNGQFFTPQHVCDMMAQVSMGKDSSGKTILDPACGSGRTLLSAAKVSRQNHFYGADVDYRCVKMTTINMCLNALPGEVAWMNSLSGEHFGGYKVEYIDMYRRIPVVTKLPANEGLIINSAPFNKAGNDRPSVQQPNVITVSQTKLSFE
jgi:type I restriction-modification system DNA methylase subunit